MILFYVCFEFAYRNQYVKLWKQQFYLRKILNKMEKEELVNEGITRKQKVDFDEKEHIAEAANILEEEETIKM